ncbi:Arp10 [Kluyveromyces lactis]|nr:Arp10 [Kluyveromyces lactis]
MTVVVVVNIGDTRVEVGYAGDFKFTGTIQRSIDWLDDDIQVNTMCRAWFHDILMYNSKGVKIVISEPLWLSMIRKQRLCKVLFGRLKVNSICFVPNCLATFIGAGIRNGLYIEVNSKNTELIPIFDGRILDSYSRSSKLGSDNVDIFYQNSTDSIDDDEIPLSVLMDNVLSKLPIDTFKHISEQIVLNTDSSQVENCIVEQKNVVAGMGPWIGTSIYTWNNLMKGLLDNSEISKSEYEQNGRVPDWNSSKFEI